MKQQGKLRPSTEANKWVPAYIAVSQFAELHPQFRISVSRPSVSRFMAALFPILEREGAAIRVGRNYLANTETFCDVCVRALTSPERIEAGEAA